MASTNILLLFGMPRSGTTWIGKIFDSHNNVIYRHEPDSVYSADNLPLITNETDIEEAGKYLDHLKTTIEKFPNEKVSSSRPIFKKKYFNPLQYYLYVISSYATKLSKKYTNRDLLKPIIQFSRNKSPPLIVWKSIESAGRLSTFTKHLNSKGILIIRHPCGHVLSVLEGENQGNFNSNNSIANDIKLFKELLENNKTVEINDLQQVLSMSPIERIALRWVLINDNSISTIENSTKIKIMLYDAICEEPLENSREMFEFAQLGFCQQTKDFLAKSINVHDKAYYSVFKTPLVAANKWKAKLSKDDIAKIQKIVNLGPHTRLIYDENSFIVN